MAINPTTSIRKHPDFDPDIMSIGFYYSESGDGQDMHCRFEIGVYDRNAMPGVPIWFGAGDGNKYLDAYDAAMRNILKEMNYPDAPGEVRP